MDWEGRVSKLYEIKLKQLERCKKRLDELIADYDAISSDISAENNRAKRQQLERQQTSCAQEMEQVAQRCDQLEQEIEKLKPKEDSLEELVSLLIPINFEIVIKAYQASNPNGRSRPVPPNIQALVQQLAEIPGEKGGIKPLCHFVSLLVQDQSLGSNNQKALKTWAQAQGMVVSEAVIEEPEIAEICLMVKVKPRVLNNPSLGYLVSAALIKDPDPFSPEIEPVATPITISVPPDPKCAPGYSQTDLPHILNELIRTCGNEHGIPLTDLVIQWFLPIELMSLPIEHWQFQIGRKQKEYSGKRCKAVIVRSSDRHFSSDYRAASGDWQKYWQRLVTIQQSKQTLKCAQALAHLDPITGKTSINWTSSKVVGCRFVEHHNPQQQEDVWDGLLSQGTPIAIWIRQPTTEKRVRPLSTCTIAQLLTSLATHRQRALSHDCEPDRLEAASLCLLFDNPHRPFPAIDYQSA
jgi:hypothetical protein